VGTSDARSIAVGLLQHADVAAITTSDVRFGRLVRAFHGSSLLFRDVLASVLERAEVDEHTEGMLARAASLIALAESVPLEVELGWIIWALRVHNPRGVMRYFGWDGSGGSTLQVAGDLAGTTRERVRQVAAKVVKALAAGPTYAPVLDRALALIEATCTAEDVVRADRIEEALVEAGVAAERFRVEGLLRAATILRRPIARQLTTVGSSRLILAADAAQRIGLVHKAARTILERWGVTTVAEVEARAREAVGGAVVLDVQTIVQTLPGFAWLDEATGWFWIGPAFGTRLYNQIWKVVAVSPRIQLGELRAGVGRPHRMQGFAPPKRVLAALLLARGGYRLEGETVVVDPAPDWRVVLSGVESILVDVLRVRGGISSRVELEEDCLARGVKRSTFYVNLGYSPIIACVGPGVYALRGVSIAPGVVDSLVTRKPRGKVLQDYGWTPGGDVWLGYRLSTSTIAAGVVSIPSALAEFITGEFEITDTKGLRLGRLGTRDYAAWGLSPLIARRGLEAGDYLSLTIDLKSRTTIARWGTEPPWELAIQPSAAASTIDEGKKQRPPE